ncbi:MAG TPA: type I methionyl aminopeptidase [Haliangiales bacterium]|nr:type I methionyl aminopeptidase [Haliangiales bacterium]
MYFSERHMRIIYKSPEEIRLMRETGLIVNEILDVLEAAIAPGVSTWQLDDIARKEIARHKVVSAFLGYHGYPAVLCTSINHVVVHGIPRKDEILAEGDVIGIDFGVFKHGLCGDSARTITVGKVSEDAQKLVDVARESLGLGLQAAVAGNRIEDIGWAVQQHAEKHGFSVVRDFCGHGIGRQMHEDPPVPNYGRPGKGYRLKPGLVLAIEPMVNAGTHEVEVLGDKWTAVTKDKSLSAHFEHTVAITEDGPFVLTRP